MLAHHLGMHRVGGQVQLQAQHLAQARGVQQGAGAQHALGGQAAGLRHHLREHVHRVGDQHHDAAKAGQCAADVGHHAGVVAQQVQPRFTRLAATPGRHHHHLGRSHLRHRRGLHLAPRIEGRAMRQIHRFALGDFGPQVMQPKFIGHARLQGRDSHAGADPAATDDAYPFVHDRALASSLDVDISDVIGDVIGNEYGPRGCALSRHLAAVHCQHVPGRPTPA